MVEKSKLLLDGYVYVLYTNILDVQKVLEWLNNFLTNNRGTSRNDLQQLSKSNYLFDTTQFCMPKYFQNSVSKNVTI